MSLDDRIKNEREGDSELTLYFHIGHSKTGTSIIQNFLDVNREILTKKYACLYPNVETVSFVLWRSFRRSNKGRCHNHVAYLDKRINRQEVLQKELASLIDFSIKKKYSSIVFSHEGLFFNKKAIVLREIFKNLQEKYSGRIDFKVILYIRRQDHFIESAWKQWGIKRFANIQAFMKGKNYYRRVKKSLETWEKVMGVENIIVHPYEKEQLEEGLLSDFMKIIFPEINMSTLLEPEKNNLAQNLGFTRDILEVMALSRDLHDDNIHDRTLNDAFADLLGPDFQKKPFEEYDFFSPDDREKILDSMEPLYAYIAKQYLGRDDGLLFYAPLLKREWREYEGLDVETIVPVLVKLILEQQKFINGGSIKKVVRTIGKMVGKRVN